MSIKKQIVLKVAGSLISLVGLSLLFWQAGWAVGLAVGLVIFGHNLEQHS